MNAHHGTIDHLDVTVVSFGNRVHDAIPAAYLAPAFEAGRTGAVALRQIAPRCTRAQDSENAVQHPSVVTGRDAAWPVRKKKFDHGPFKVRQVVTSAHMKAPTVWKLESHRRSLVIPYMVT